MILVHRSSSRSFTDMLSLFGLQTPHMGRTYQGHYTDGDKGISIPKHYKLALEKNALVRIRTGAVSTHQHNLKPSTVSEILR